MIFQKKMNHPTKIIIIDQGTPIPKYLLSMITEVINSLVVTTEALAPNDCSGKINF
jgi:PII-like signaling protein